MRPSGTRRPGAAPRPGTSASSCANGLPAREPAAHFGRPQKPWASVSRPAGQAARGQASKGALTGTECAVSDRVRPSEETVMRPVRVDYDAIAQSFDSGPHRTKTVDPELLAFIEQRISGDLSSILDMGCGTGNQLIADRPALPSAQLVGLDRSLGMLRQARPKAPDIAWVQADASVLPFRTESFDFITCQFALHHIQDKLGMLRETFRVLRIGGRLILRNPSPQECADWLYYDYVPEAQRIDLEDFWPPETIMAEMHSSGFVALTEEREHLHFEQDLRSWFDTVRGGVTPVLNS